MAFEASPVQKVVRVLARFVNILRGLVSEICILLTPCLFLVEFMFK